jgi:hypothetical protein
MFDLFYAFDLRTEKEQLARLTSRFQNPIKLIWYLL